MLTSMKRKWTSKTMLESLDKDPGWKTKLFDDLCAGLWSKDGELPRESPKRKEVLKFWRIVTVSCSRNVAKMFFKNWFERVPVSTDMKQKLAEMFGILWKHKIDGRQLDGNQIIRHFEDKASRKFSQAEEEMGKQCQTQGCKMIRSIYSEYKSSDDKSKMKRSIQKILKKLKQQEQQALKDDLSLHVEGAYESVKRMKFCKADAKDMNEFNSEFVAHYDIMDDLEDEKSTMDEFFDTEFAIIARQKAEFPFKRLVRDVADAGVERHLREAMLVTPLRSTKTRIATATEDAVELLGLSLRSHLGMLLDTALQSMQHRATEKTEPVLTISDLTSRIATSSRQNVRVAAWDRRTIRNFSYTKRCKRLKISDGQS
eukprot:g597.t1